MLRSDNVFHLADDMVQIGMSFQPSLDSDSLLPPAATLNRHLRRRLIAAMNSMAAASES